MRVIVTGGGIGGLAAAIGLRRVGCEVTVLERSAVLAPVGSGISLHSNAMEALRRLGVDADVRARGGPLRAGRVTTSSGRVLQQQSLDPFTDRLGQPSGVALHRAELQEALLQAAVGPGDAPAAELLTGTEVTGYRLEPDRAIAVLADGEREADVLIGADGIHSAVASELRGRREPRYAGYTAWRGLVDADRVDLPEGTGLEMFGRGQRLGVIPIGGGLVYWFCTANAPQGQSAGGPDAELALVARLFGDWAEPVPSLLAATSPERFLRNDIVDHPPDRRWGDGRLTLLGDAAHAMTPNTGQGAAQAIEDAVVLAHELGRGDHPAVALRRYEARRWPRAAGFVRASWWIGWSGQWSSPILTTVRDALAGVPGAAVFARPGLWRMLRFPYPDALAAPLTVR